MESNILQHAHHATRLNQRPPACRDGVLYLALSTRNRTENQEIAAESQANTGALKKHLRTLWLQGSERVEVPLFLKLPHK